MLPQQKYFEKLLFVPLWMYVNVLGKSYKKETWITILTELLWTYLARELFIQLPSIGRVTDCMKQAGCPQAKSTGGQKSQVHVGTRGQRRISRIHPTIRWNTRRETAEEQNPPLPGRFGHQFKRKGAQLWGRFEGLSFVPKRG